MSFHKVKCSTSAHTLYSKPLFSATECCLLATQSDLLLELQIIYTANEEVARGLYNPAYKLLQMLPLPRNKGQLCMRRFHTIMQDLLQEVTLLLHSCKIELCNHASKHVSVSLHLLRCYSSGAALQLVLSLGMHPPLFHWQGRNSLAHARCEYMLGPPEYACITSVQKHALLK